MKHLIKKTFYISFVVVIFNQAEAYIDPGTGSLIIQGVIAAVTGGLLFFKSIITKLKSFWRKYDKNK